MIILSRYFLLKLAYTTETQLGFCNKDERRFDVRFKTGRDLPRTR